MVQIKTVCFVIHSLQAGGMERVMAEIVNHFVGLNKYSVHLILYGIHRDVFFKIDPSVKIHRPKFIFSRRFRLVSTLRTLFFLRNELKKISPDAILSFGERWNNFVLLSTTGLAVPIYVSDRSQPNLSLGVIHDALRCYLYPKSKGVIVQTEKARKIHSRMYSHNNVVVVPNPVRQIAPGKWPRKKEILMVARLIESKQHDHLLSVFAKLTAPDWKLVIIGCSNNQSGYLGCLKKKAEELNVSNRVAFLGKIHDVETYYQSCAIFAFTSRSEGLPNAIIEAMSAGMPIVAYDCIAGPSELVQHGENGFLVPLGDKVTFQKRIQELIFDDKLQERFGKKSIELAKKYKASTICERFERVVCFGENNNSQLNVSGQ
jgi:GalNAc-alpha-(1->4)-GalNAc-alpha-(1->3)-diNAcBac-PP-undecaprenol alpha-1,4-N-acetyl-D-galactosaminyltransferase